MIKAIETRYKGCRFRSRLEARWAVFFDTLGVKWEYEKEGYDLGAAGRYLPDFWLPNEQVWVEIKPSTAVVPVSSIFLAGKMNGWRSALDTRHHRITGPDERVRIINNAHDTFSATGMEFSDSGSTSISEACSYLWSDNKQAIEDATYIFVWLATADALGTVAEAAWAVGIGKQVYLAAPSICWDDCAGHGCGNTTEWWVLEQLATRTYQCLDPQEAFDHWFPPVTADHIVKSAALSSGGHSVFNFCGTPWNDEPCQIQLFDKGKFIMNVESFPFEDTDTITRPGDRACRVACDAARAARFEHGETPQ